MAFYHFKKCQNRPPWDGFNDLRKDWVSSTAIFFHCLLSLSQHLTSMGKFRIDCVLMDLHVHHRVPYSFIFWLMISLQIILFLMSQPSSSIHLMYPCSSGLPSFYNRTWVWNQFQYWHNNLFQGKLLPLEQFILLFIMGTSGVTSPWRVLLLLCRGLPPLDIFKPPWWVLMMAWKHV